MHTHAWVERFEVRPTGRGPLAGLRFGVKDLIDVAGHPTGCGNPERLRTAPTAVSHAPVIEGLLAEGATLCGKTVTDEMAFSLMGENIHYGTPLNPRAPDRVPGGSSSGSASAVAARECDFALGTDTGGSVRVPSSHCGVFGFRPTTGIISVAGVHPLAPSFDTVGLLASEFEVLRIVVNLLTRLPEHGLPGHIEEVLFPTQVWDLVDRSVREALDPVAERTVAELGARPSAWSLDEVDAGEGGAQLEGWLATYCQIQWAEAWSVNGAWIENSLPRFGDQIAATFELARQADRSHFHRHCERREKWAAALERALSPGTVLCMPTVPEIAPPRGGVPVNRAGSRFYQRSLPMNALAGIGRLPQVSLPLGEAEGAPVGLSFLARPRADCWLLERLATLFPQKREIPADA